jgi:hypothetical protein
MAAKKATPKIVATAKATSNIPVIEAGTYAARCYSMVHIGTVEDEYKGKKIKVNRVRLTWELPTELYVFDEEKGEQPRVISKEYTLSLSEKANLRKDLEAWRGKQFTQEELDGFDITAVVGAPCQVSVVNKVSKSSGNTYAQVTAVSKTMKGLKVADQVNDSVVFAYVEDDEELLELFSQLPEFVQDQIVEADEWKARGLERPQTEGDDDTPKDEVSKAVAEAEESAQVTKDDDDEDPPF